MIELLKRKNLVSPLMKVTVLVLLLLGLTTCQQKKQSLTFTSGDLEIQMDGWMRIKVSSSKSLKPLMTDFYPSDYIVSENKIADFSITSNEKSRINSGYEWKISGLYEEGEISIRKTTTINTLDAFPGLVTMQSEFENLGEPITIKKVVSSHLKIASTQEANPSFWTFQGSSSSERADWIRPVSEGYYQENYMGMNNSDYGGGIPVTDIWRPDVGIAIGHTNKVPTLVSLPTEMKLREKEVNISVEEKMHYPTFFGKGESFETTKNFILTHQGDYYNALSTYSNFMQSQGIEMPSSEDAAYESIWCAWGYERNFTMDEVIGTIPKVKELGIKWVVMDDGFQIAEGDWQANPERFSNRSIKNLVSTIHNHGLKAKIWWAPLAADPGSKVLEETPEARLFTEEWTPQFITWWDAYYLAPNNPHTEKHTKATINLFMKEWGFDGLKLDGQHMNAVPPDHNPDSKLDYPEQAVETLPNFFEMIYNEARSIKPNAVVENCPCGTCMSYFNMPFMNQAVSSDPLSSWQIRHKGKTYKALIPNTAYYGDHVELSDNASDFASSFGIGAVLGTKFTWPKDNPTVENGYLLTPEKEVVWKKWFNLYDELMLSKEKYLGGLYDIGYDKPETHVIEKGQELFYAFYADTWNGEIEFRGLQDMEYTITDYFNNIELGTIASSQITLDVSFEDFLLARATPK